MPKQAECGQHCCLLLCYYHGNGLGVLKAFIRGIRDEIATVIQLCKTGC